MEWDQRHLRKILGIGGFRQFAKEYLIARGESSEAAEGIVEETEAHEVKRLEKLRLEQGVEQRRKLHREEPVFAGLLRVPAPLPEYPDEKDEGAQSTGRTGWFDPTNFAEVLRRCMRLGIRVTRLRHRSSDAEKDRIETGNLDAPLEILAAWQADGRDEKLYDHCRVPNSLVKGLNCFYHDEQS